MIKFDGAVFVPSGKEPLEMLPMMNHYGLVNRFLQQFNQGRFSTADKIANTVIDTRISYGVTQTFSHGLRFAPSVVVPTGRVDFLQLVSADNSVVKVRCKLHTVQIINPVFGRPQNRITVSDTYFFQVGDQVRIGGKTAGVTAIVDSQLLLDASLVYNDTYAVSLAQENVRLFIF